VGAYRVHGEPEQALSGLDVPAGWRGVRSERPLDVEAVLARNPQVVCLDDLAELDSKGRPRLEAVPILLRAGITVLATLHLLSVQSAAAAVSSLLGRTRAGPLIPDELLGMFDELEVVDVPPAELLQRIAEDGILSPAERAVAMQQELRPSVLAMLRETALRIVADHVDRQFVAELREGQWSWPYEVRARIALCLPVLPGLEQRIRGAARYAREQDATFAVVSVRRPGLSEDEKALLGAYTTLTHQLGGEFLRLESGQVADALARYIQGSQTTEVILGHRRRSSWQPWDTTSQLIRLLEGVDIHILRRQS
jgi:two-component system sensor histidine kinase KdpD